MNTPKSIVKFRRFWTIGLQLAMVVVANMLAFVLRFDGVPPTWAINACVTTLPWLIVIRGLTFVPFRLFEGLWRYTSIYDLRAIIGAVASSSALFIVLAKSPFGPAVYPRTIFVTDALILVLMLGGIRLSRRVYAELSGGRKGKRVVVFGAGNAGELVVRDMKINREYGYQPIGFVDDDVNKVGRRIHGVPVLGTRKDLKEIVAKHKPDEILMAMPNADPASMRAVVRELQAFKIPIKTLPKLTDIIGGKIELNEIRNLSLEDLLARPPVGLDPAPVKHLIRGRRVMVTGAGGSIGSELCRQIVKLKPASLVMFERYENSLHAVRMELEDTHPSCALHCVIGDVADTACVSAVMQQHVPEIVFHAAAHKHVPLMEENPCEAIKNNVRGTRLLAQAAEFFGVDRFIFISTDKAVNPTSVMGASKRLAELAIQTQAMGSGTSFGVVRFGNVLGSNGSVVPRFLDQIRRGGPVTITHPEMRRFFMLIPEAVQLGAAGAARGVAGRERRHLRAGDGRAGQAARHGARPDSAGWLRSRRRDPHRVHRAAAGREALRGAGRHERSGGAVGDREDPPRQQPAQAGSRVLHAARDDRDAGGRGERPGRARFAEAPHPRILESGGDRSGGNRSRSGGRGRRRGRWRRRGSGEHAGGHRCAASVLPELCRRPRPPLARAQPQRADASQAFGRTAVPLRGVRLARLADAAGQPRGRAGRRLPRTGFLERRQDGEDHRDSRTAPLLAA
jgi:FlaA1/EpsC-like NDP-sugar epimerase